MGERLELCIESIVACKSFLLHIRNSNHRHYQDLLNSIITQVILSAPNPSVVWRLGGQFTSIIISTTVASPENLLLLIAFSSLFSSLFLVPLRGGDLPKLLPLPVFVGLELFTDVDVPGDCGS